MSTRLALDSQFTVVTAHPTVKGKFMVVTSERPCAGCMRASNLCAYILSPLGEQIFKASKCTHCAATRTRCGQAGALYRFDKEMREGHLIDPYASSSEGGGSESEQSVATSSASSSSDSGNDAGSEDGTAASSANTSGNSITTPAAAPSAPASARASGAANGSAETEHNTPPLAPRMRRSSAPTPSSTPSRRNSAPPPLKLDKDPLNNPNGPRADSPGKSVRFALPPPSPPLSNTSPTANGHAEGVRFAAPTASTSAASEAPAPGPLTNPNTTPTPKSKTKTTSTLLPKNPVSARPPSPAPLMITVPSSATSNSAPLSPPADDPKFHRILNKLTDLEIRLGCVESINHELRAENRRLQKKNSNLKRTVITLRTANRVSGDGFLRALKLVEDVEADRRRLMEIMK